MNRYYIAIITINIREATDPPKKKLFIESLII